MNCLDATLSRIGGFSASAALKGPRLGAVASLVSRIVTGFSRTGDRVECSATRRGHMTVSFGLVCDTGFGEQVLWASDQMVLTVDGNKIYVRK